MVASSYQKNNVRKSTFSKTFLAGGGTRVYESKVGTEIGTGTTTVRDSSGKVISTSVGTGILPQPNSSPSPSLVSPNGGKYFVSGSGGSGYKKGDVVYVGSTGKITRASQDVQGKIGEQGIATGLTQRGQNVGLSNLSGVGDASSTVSGRGYYDFGKKGFVVIEGEKKGTFYPTSNVNWTPTNFQRSYNKEIQSLYSYSGAKNRSEKARVLLQATGQKSKLSEFEINKVYSNNEFLVSGLEKGYKGWYDVKNIINPEIQQQQSEERFAKQYMTDIKKTGELDLNFNVTSFNNKNVKSEFAGYTYKEPTYTIQKGKDIIGGFTEGTAKSFNNIKESKFGKYISGESEFSNPLIVFGKNVKKTYTESKFSKVSSDAFFNYKSFQDKSISKTISFGKGYVKPYYPIFALAQRSYDITKSKKEVFENKYLLPNLQKVEKFSGLSLGQIISIPLSGSSGLSLGKTIKASSIIGQEQSLYNSYLNPKTYPSQLATIGVGGLFGRGSFYLTSKAGSVKNIVGRSISKGTVKGIGSTLGLIYVGSKISEYNNIQNEKQFYDLNAITSRELTNFYVGGKLFKSSTQLAFETIKKEPVVSKIDTYVSVKKSGFELYGKKVYASSEGISRIDKKGYKTSQYDLNIPNIKSSVGYVSNVYPKSNVKISGRIYNNRQYLNYETYNFGGKFNYKIKISNNNLVGNFYKNNKLVFSEYKSNIVPSIVFSESNKVVSTKSYLSDYDIRKEFNVLSRESYGVNLKFGDKTVSKSYNILTQKLETKTVSPKLSFNIENPVTTYDFNKGSIKIGSSSDTAFLNIGRTKYDYVSYLPKQKSYKVLKFDSPSSISIIKPSSSLTSENIFLKQRTIIDPTGKYFERTKFSGTLLKEPKLINKMLSSNKKGGKDFLTDNLLSKQNSEYSNYNLNKVLVGKTEKVKVQKTKLNPKMLNIKTSNVYNINDNISSFYDLNVFPSTKSLNENKNISSPIQKNFLKEFNIQNEKTINPTKVKSFNKSENVQKNFEKTKLFNPVKNINVQKNFEKTKSFISIKQVQSNFQKQLNITNVISFKYTPNVNPRITKTPDTTITKVPFSFWIKDSKRKKKNKFVISTKFGSKYNPSLTSGIFSIKGKMPSKISVVSGLGVRPITKEFSSGNIAKSFAF